MTTDIQQFNYNVNVQQAILWQYNSAAGLNSIINSKQIWYDTWQTNFWSTWYANVFNLLTANDFGLSVWSIILALPLFIPVNPPDPNGLYWGFNKYNPSFPTLENSYQNFNNGNFAETKTITLTTEEQRLILRMQYYKLISRGSVTDTNTFLNELFTTAIVPYTGSAWMLDGLDMTVTYVFNFDLPQYMRDLFVQYDLLPRPAGVGIKYVVVTGTIFGFNKYDPTRPTLENTNQNFSNGNFKPIF